MQTFSQDFIAKNSVDRHEPQWLINRRSDAFAKFDQLSLPKTNEEIWRRTDIRGLKLDQFKPICQSDFNKKELDQIRSKILENSAGTLIQIDGTVAHFETPEKKIYFADLQTALKDRPKLVEKYLGRAIRKDPNKLEAMHDAFLHGGYFLHVPRGTIVEFPIEVFIALTNDAIADFSHTIIVAEADSQITVFEEHISTDPQINGFHSGGVEIFLDQNAIVNYVQIQNWNQKTWAFSTQRAIIDRSANLRWITAPIGSRLTKYDQLVELAGIGSHAEMLGLTFANARQHIDLHTFQKHSAPNTTSDLLYRNVITDRSRTVWRGMIEVAKDAQKIDSYQKNDNLMLDTRARADTIPGLEIHADDVRCTHGATVGQIDKDQIFYLMSRGVPKSIAEKMIIDGFFDPVLQRIPNEATRDRLEKSINAKLAVSG